VTNPGGAGEAYYPRLSPLSTALRCRCPRCGEGPLFAGYLTVVSECAICRLNLRAHDSGDGPATILIFALGFLVVPLALWVEAKLEPPYLLHIILWPLVIVGLTLGALRPIKAFFVAQHYRHRRIGNDRDD
jgi:uncharacterized protein (DUF983 family)